MKHLILLLFLWRLADVIRLGLTPESRAANAVNTMRMDGKYFRTSSSQTLEYGREAFINEPTYDDKTDRFSN